MRLTLQPHPDWPGDAVTGIEAEALRTARGELELCYSVTGAVDELLMPPFTQSVRTDGLWRHTCFEAFLRAPQSDAYYELNLAPSSQWAAYHFDSYRDGMRIADIPAIAIAASTNGGRYEMRAGLDLTALDLPTEAPWRLGLSAVIEQRDGRKSFWALAHPRGQADFHHEDCFARQLPAAEPL
ncbi:DOMON-like domain-containing protein [Sphingosinicella rhizophila]|uniref:DOMON-like domain-containing protein n=1 Tax=Sphingosinicella rhizophila TaxID=3050082 RepID=A0ABU3Q2H6_9SPHN|nr:DOMON-like domain-containing protein [Sphingosinicella sp. GR2756]MDT9597609.1 DOMON-like domain-containing protein [Sphingosinicella sp. GR2756]